MSLLWGAVCLLCNKIQQVSSSVGAACIWLTGRQAAPDYRDRFQTCLYDLLWYPIYYKQVAPTELWERAFLFFQKSKLLQKIRNAPLSVGSDMWKKNLLYEAQWSAEAFTVARMWIYQEGSHHSWWWNPIQNERSSVPRHTEINNTQARKTCNDLVTIQRNLLNCRRSERNCTGNFVSSEGSDLTNYKLF